MKQLTATIFLLFASALNAREGDVSFETSADLRDWCEKASQALFISKDVTPYNWSSSWWEEVNTFYVKGSWRVGRKDVIVECSAGRGAQSRDASIVIRDRR